MVHVSVDKGSVLTVNSKNKIQARFGQRGIGQLIMTPNYLSA